MQTTAAESDLVCSLLEEGRAGPAARAPPRITADVAVALPQHGRDGHRYNPIHALAGMRAAVWFFNTVALVLLGIVAVKLVPLCKTTQQVFICILSVLICFGMLVMGYCMIKITKDDIKAMEASR
ncbi:hypothetical protein E2562_022261 [Oryza meyeriana var. granulata]|uniref:Uncharacterized protein n=1 Tax=Oryza meyeriana var. granulata TaxID=110450 RepID=A0A6G1D643_9ORYZ|nr:hypothetical protein E2562_022261 [Oryza meyeriana var. granulata]